MKHVLFALVVAAPALMAALLLNRANKSLDRVSVLAEEVAQDVKRTLSESRAALQKVGAAAEGSTELIDTLELKPLGRAIASAEKTFARLFCCFRSPHPPKESTESKTWEQSAGVKNAAEDHTLESPKSP